MTRRIAITILLTVWSAIILAGLATWFTARQVLLSDLDSSILQRAVTVAGLSTSAAPHSRVFQEDRYVIKGPLDQTLGRQAAPVPSGDEPQIVDRAMVSLPEGRFRRLTLLVPAGAGRTPLKIIYSASAGQFDRVLWRLAGALIACGVGAGVIAAAASAYLARLALGPLKKTADVIGAIDEANLDRRIDPAPIPAELRPVVGRLNEMLQRLESSFEQRRRFLADASHELRTPVAAMFTTLEVALRRPRPVCELTQTVQVCLAEAAHLRQLVQALLQQVRADGKAAAADNTIFDAGEVVRQCAGLSEAIAAERGIQIVRHAEGAMPIMGDSARLRSALLNLVGNAIDYNHEGGVVDISASCENGSLRIAVADDGPGIEAEHLPHLFQPFYRVSAAHEADGHLGLGLSLVESHVRSLGGECRVESRFGAGTTFHIRLPLASDIQTDDPAP